jgi:hypothetical protein
MISSFIRPFNQRGGSIIIIIINSLITRRVEKNQSNHGLHALLFVHYPLMLHQHIPLELTNALSSLVLRLPFIELADNPFLNLQIGLSSS